jgi:N-acetylmuramic acid 6-phosphate etherase
MSTLPATERANQAAVPLDEMATLEMLERINGEDAGVAIAVRAELPAVARAVDALADRLRQGGRLILIGAGTSGRLALMQAAEARPTFGIPPTMVIGVMAGGPEALTHPIEGAEDDAVAGGRQIEELAVVGQDAVAGISASGRTPFVLGALAEARKRTALTIGLCCDHPTPISDAVDIAIHPIVGPEVIAGSTRLKAGTAQKLVLDMLTTAVMVRLGFVHANLMVGVQGTNTKLRNRARRIVEQVTGRTGAPVDEALASAGWSARLAIVMLARGVDAAEARRLLGTGARLADLIGEEPAGE